jgi:hypothetical protein
MDDMNNEYAVVFPPQAKQESGTAPDGSAKAPESGSRISAEAILERIDAIRSDSTYIFEAIGAIKDMEGFESKPGAAEDTRPKAISTIIQARETTNQQALRLLEKMYDDMRPSRPSAEPDKEAERFRQVAESLSHFPGMDQDYVGEILSKMSQQMFVKAGSEIVK